MENKINIAELLKDCPRDMELDCTMYDNLYFDYIREHAIYPIVCYIVNSKGEKIEITFNWYGKHIPIDTAKCVIFPKGKTTWEGFQRPFKDGDIVFYDNCVSIFKEWVDETLFRNYVKVDIDGKHPMLCARTSSFGKGVKREARFATEEEKAKLFQAIKDNGYHWNAETKTLEKLAKFKVGDKVQWKEDIREKRIIDNVLNNCYTVKGYGVILFTAQDEWELVPNKFDITTLKLFDKVLVRTNVHNPVWSIDFYGGYDIKIGGSFTPFAVTSGKYFQQCIPYEGNQHLRGTTNDCDDFYKIW